jgi:hypothetical protein
MILLVTYDLKGTSALYADLFEVLKAQEGWSHYLKSTWLVAGDYESAHDLFRELKPFIREGDRLLVIEVTADYSGWLPTKAWSWIKRNLDKEWED